MSGTMPSLTSVHGGDLHMDEANGWQSRDRLAAVVVMHAWPGHGIEGTRLGPHKNGQPR